MSNLPEGWDLYDPNEHERSADTGYREARRRASERAVHRRAAYGKALSALRQARLMTQVVLADQLGVAQSEVSRLEHQTDLLLSTVSRYVQAVGGELSLLVRFEDAAESDLVIQVSDILEEEPGARVLIASDPTLIAELAARIARLPFLEERFRGSVPA